MPSRNWLPSRGVTAVSRFALEDGFLVSVRLPPLPLAVLFSCHRLRPHQFACSFTNWGTYASFGGTKHLPYVTFGNPYVAVICGTDSN